jgi:hypothetical protein
MASSSASWQPSVSAWTCIMAAAKTKAKTMMRLVAMNIFRTQLLRSSVIFKLTYKLNGPVKLLPYRVIVCVSSMLGRLNRSPRMAFLNEAVYICVGISDSDPGVDMIDGTCPRSDYPKVLKLTAMPYINRSLMLCHLFLISLVTSSSARLSERGLHSDINQTVTTFL